MTNRKNQMKRLNMILAALMLAISTAVNAQTAGLALQLSLADGTSVTCLFDKQPQMTFTTGTLTLTTTDGNIGTWNFADVEQWTFVAADGISSPVAAKGIAINGNTISLSGTDALGATLYDITGKAIATAAPSASGSAVSLSGLQPGVYVLRAGRNTIKFNVR